MNDPRSWVVLSLTQRIQLRLSTDCKLEPRRHENFAQRIFTVLLAKSGIIRGHPNIKKTLATRERLLFHIAQREDCFKIRLRLKTLAQLPRPRTPVLKRNVLWFWRRWKYELHAGQPKLAAGIQSTPTSTGVFKDLRRLSKL